MFLKHNFLFRVSDANTWDVWITKVASGVLNRSMLDSNVNNKLLISNKIFLK